MSSLKTEFQFRNYKVEIISNADDAWDLMIKRDDVELVIIDIMLAAKPPNISKYSRSGTRDYTTTGILLAEDLLIQFPQIFKGKIVYLSHTNENGLLNLIEKSAEDNDITFLRKHNYASDMKLAEDILNSVNLSLEKE